MNDDLIRKGQTSILIADALLAMLEAELRYKLVVAMTTAPKCNDVAEGAK